MSGPDTHKGLIGFKHVMSNALARAADRFGRRIGGKALLDASQHSVGRCRQTIADPNATPSPPTPQSPSFDSDPESPMEHAGPEPSQSIVEWDRARSWPASCHPAVDGGDLTPADDEPVIEDERLSSLSVGSASDAPQADFDDRTFGEAFILARLLPEFGAEVSTAIGLSEARTLSSDRVLYPTVTWTEGYPGFAASRLETDPCRRLLAVADSENTVTPVTDTLCYAGVLKKNGKLRRKRVRGLQIVHTGDMIFKHQPDPAVAGFWLKLGKRVERLGGALILLAGNHELEILDCLHRGQRLGMKKRQCEAVRALIGRCRLFHLSGSALFIHGYPTLNLLRALKRYEERTGVSIDHYNTQCFQPSLDDPAELAHYRYLKGKGSQKLLLHDLDDPVSYYRTHGKEVAALLRSFGIEQVVHGHRPERSGIQADYEYRHCLPGIRMIGNDTQLRQRGLGGVVMRMQPEGETQVVLMNTKTCDDDQRRSVRALLRGRVPVCRDTVALETSPAAAAMAARCDRACRADISPA